MRARARALTAHRCLQAACIRKIRVLLTLLAFSLALLSALLSAPVPALSPSIREQCHRECLKHRQTRNVARSLTCVHAITGGKATRIPRRMARERTTNKGEEDEERRSETERKTEARPACLCVYMRVYVTCMCVCVCIAYTARRIEGIVESAERSHAPDICHLNLRTSPSPEHLEPSRSSSAIRAFTGRPDTDCVLDCDSRSWYAAARPRLRRLLVLVAGDRRHRTLFCTVTHITGGSWHSRLSRGLPLSFPEKQSTFYLLLGCSPTVHRCAQVHAGFYLRLP